MAKGVFKQEVNWSSFQDKQLKILDAIESSFNDSLSISKSINTSLYKVEYIMERVAKELVNDVDDFNAGLSTAGNSVSLFHRFLGTSTTTLRSFDDTIKDTSKSLSKTSTAFYQITGVVGTLIHQLGGWRGLAEKINNSSTVSNQLIQNSGMRGDTVREIRSEIASQVRELNIGTDNYFNAQKSYEKLVSYTADITNDLEAMNTMAKPLLLASEAMHIDMKSVTSIFNRFYNRYRFSSSNMEEVLTEIKGNTAGNSATEEAVLKNISSLEGWINNTAGDNNTLREELLKRTSNFTSWIESMNMDSSVFTDYMDKVAGGAWNDPAMSKLIGVLNQSERFSSIGAQGMTDLVRRGEYTETSEILMDGIHSLLKRYDNNSDGSLTAKELMNIDTVLSIYGLDRKFALDIFNTVESKGFTTLDKYIETAENNKTSLSTLVNDKFMTASDKIENLLSNIYEKVASIQEYLPFGVSDIVIAITLWKSIFGKGSSLGGQGGMIPSLDSLRSIGINSAIKGAVSQGTGSTLLPGSTSLAKVAGLGGGLGGAAMLAGGVTAGALLAVDGVKGVFNEDKDITSRTLSGVEAGAGIGGAAALIGLGVTNPIGWAVLAVGGVALLAKGIYENVNAYKEGGKLIEKEFNNAKAVFTKEIVGRETSLEEIKGLLSDESNIEEARKRLLDSGLLSEEDKVKATDGNVTALEKLTEAYLIATKDFEDKGNELLDKYKGIGRDDTNDTMKSIKNWYSENKNVESTENSNIMRNMIYAVIDQLESKDNLTKDEQWFYSKYKSNMSEGKDKQKDWEWLLDKGNNLSVFYGNIKGESLENFTKNSGINGLSYNYRSPDEITKYILPIAAATNSEEAESALQSAKNAGIKKDDYEEIGKVLQKYNLTYKEGTNYIEEDQIAFLHEGEAVVPRKYNPEANKDELELLREQSLNRYNPIATNVEIEQLKEQTQLAREQYSEDSENSQQHLEESSAILREIKEFLSEWKSDNSRREDSKERKEKFSSNRAALAGFFSQR